MLKPHHRIKNRYSKSFRVLKEFDNHEMVIEFTDKETKLKGCIAIHDTNLGPALGGTRLQYYPSEEEAIRDVLNLSKAMSYKCALAGLPWGGGKAVIFANSEADKDKMLQQYAIYVEKLNGLFKTGTDVGIVDKDVAKMARYTSHMLGVSDTDRGDLTTSGMAALGVYYCIKTSVKHVFGNDSLKDRTIGVKGLGKLGGELVRLLHEDGARLVVADADKQKTKKILKQYSDIIEVDPSEIHRQVMDVYAPCALGNEFTNKVVNELRTRIVAGGANNQLANESVGDKLFDRNILYAPDYVANSGGLIYVADELEKDGFRKERVLQRVKDIQLTLEEIYTMSKKQKTATHRIANEVGMKRIEAGNPKV
jgi:glutamate dehydrogenase/leucine dehydrogenase